jgi:hypothetical protein
MTTADVGDATALLASEDERTLQHELQHVFDKITYVESEVGARGRRGEEARANLLGMEYRARLAEMAFAHDLDKVEDAMQEARENAALEVPIPERAEMRVQIEADRLVCAKLGRHKNGAAIRRAAAKLLDQAYRQAYGLTYSQIVEPFTIVEPRSVRPGAAGPASWRPPV